MWHIYILLCDNSIFHVGLTNDIERRIKEHLSGYYFYTKKFKKIELVYKELHDSRIKAEKREQQLKKWSAAKKKALISNDLELLRNLSKGSAVVE